MFKSVSRRNAFPTRDSLNPDDVYPWPTALPVKRMRRPKHSRQTNFRYFVKRVAKKPKCFAYV